MKITSYVQVLLRSREQAKPEKQGATYQERNGQLNGDPTRILGQKEEENATEQHSEANAHEPTKLVLEGSPGYEPAADFAGRTLQMLPAEATLTGRTNSTGQRTAYRLAATLGHTFAPFQKVRRFYVNAILL